MAQDSVDTTTVFDKSSKILETVLTFDWLEKTLQNCLQTCATFEDCKATRIGLGQGFLSFIIHIEPKWAQETKQKEVLPTDLILKVPTTTTMDNMDKMFDGAESSKEIQAMKEMMEGMNIENLITMVHQCECEAYKLLAPYHKELRMPKCYYQEKISDEHPGAIIMQYLAGNKGVAKKWHEPLNKTSLLQVAEAFAVLHAWCYSNRPLWEGNPHLKMSFVDVMQMTEEQIKKSTQTTVEALKEGWPDKFNLLADRIHEFGFSLENVERFKNLHEEYKIPAVLTHGDLHLGNLMFEKDTESGKPTSEVLAIIDWQTVHPGCVAEDFARLLTSSVTTKVRRESTDAMLTRYYEKLTAELDGVDPGFTYDTLKKAYRGVFKTAAAMMLGVLPFLAKNKGMLGDDPEAAAAELMDRTHGLLVDAVAALDDEQ